MRRSHKYALDFSNRKTSPLSEITIKARGCSLDSKNETNNLYIAFDYAWNKITK